MYEVDEHDAMPDGQAEPAKISKQSAGGKVLLATLKEEHKRAIRRLVSAEDPEARGAVRMCEKLAKDLLDTEL